MPKGKLWSKLFTRKESEDKALAKPSEPAQSGLPAAYSETEIRGLELPSKPCHFCYEPFRQKELVYKCEHCDTTYHYPDCVKTQTSCRVCGETIAEKGNLFKLIKLRSVICPQCGMKVKLFFSMNPKLDVSCPSCGHEGHLPNPYLKILKERPLKETAPLSRDEQKAEDEQVEPEEALAPDKALPKDEELDVWDEEELEEVGEVEEVEEVGDLGYVEKTVMGEAFEEGPKIIQQDEHRKRKAKLVTLEQTLSCNVCLEPINAGSPVVVCKCGKKYHEKCAKSVGDCPRCDGDLVDIERLLDEDEDVTKGALGIGLKPDKELEPEPEPEIKLELGTELNPELTFDQLAVEQNNKILHSVGQAVAESPGKEYGLIYIYGPEGRGKTQLLQAMGNHAMKTGSNQNVRYTTSDKFYAELAQAVELDKLDEFIEFYSGADLLLFDDFSDFPNTKAEQEIFFRIFDELLINKKQIVLTGSTPIDEIGNLSKGSMKKIISLCGITINLSIQED